MESSERSEFIKVLTVTFEMLGFKLSNAATVGYWDIIAPKMSLAEFKAAASRVAEQATYQPRPADFLKAQGKASIAIEDRAVIAWGCVLQAIRDTSGYATVDFDDPVINATIRDLGGWINLSEKSSEELHKWTIKDFTRAYCAYARTPGSLSDEALAPLVGLTEASCELQFRPKLAPDTWQTIGTGLPRLPGLPAPIRRKQIGGDPRQAATIAASLNGVGR